MIYLAAPYTHPNTSVQRHRVGIAARIAGHLMLQGHVVYAPTVHGHEIAEAVPAVARASWEDLWREQSIHMLRRADSLYVICLDGWRESRGVREELEEARRLGINIEFFTTLVRCHPGIYWDDERRADEVHFDGNDAL